MSSAKKCTVVQKANNGFSMSDQVKVPTKAIFYQDECV